MTSIVSETTKCTQREQNARLDVTSLTSFIQNCIIDHLLLEFEAMLEDIKMKPKMLINFLWISLHWGTHAHLDTEKLFCGSLVSSQ